MPLGAALPTGACDCHVHVFGAAAAFPMVTDRLYTPGPATFEALRTHLAHSGLSRAVVVQPSVYGTDNSCLLDTLQQSAGAARGVAVVASDASDELLRAMSAQGVRGVRLNVESAAERDPKALSRSLAYWAERVTFLNWHIQVFASFDTLAAVAPWVANLSVPLVLDHFAMAPEGIDSQDTRFSAVLNLVRSGSAYVKLSAPYRLLPSGGNAHHAGAALALANRYVQANTSRVLWGSDWPHTHRDASKTALEVSAYRKIEPAALMRDLQAWLPGSALPQSVLVDNPAHLYGFGADR